MSVLALTPASAPAPATAKTEDDSSKDEWKKFHMYFWPILRGVSLVISILVVLRCRKIAPFSTPLDMWTVLGIFFFPEFFLLYKLYRYAKGYECSAIAEQRAVRIAEIELAPYRSPQ